MIVFSTPHLVFFFHYPVFFLRAEKEKFKCIYFDGNRKLGFVGKQCDENEKGVYSLPAIKV